MSYKFKNNVCMISGQSCQRWRKRWTLLEYTHAAPEVAFEWCPLLVLPNMIFTSSAFSPASDLRDDHGYRETTFRGSKVRMQICAFMFLRCVEDLELSWSEEGTIFKLCTTAQFTLIKHVLCRKHSLHRGSVSRPHTTLCTFQIWLLLCTKK